MDCCWTYKRRAAYVAKARRLQLDGFEPYGRFNKTPHGGTRPSHGRGLFTTRGCQREPHGCARHNADCDFQPRRRQKRTESGLSEMQFEFKSFTIIAAENRTGSRRRIAG
jgi:hypothetical protein